MNSRDRTVDQMVQAARSGKQNINKQSWNQIVLLTKSKGNLLISDPAGFPLMRKQKPHQPTWLLQMESL